MKKLLVAILAIVLALSLVACNNTEDLSQNEGNTSSGVQEQYDTAKEEEKNNEMIEAELFNQQENNTETSDNIQSDNTTTPSLINSESYVCYDEETEQIWAYMSADYLLDGTVSLNFNGSGTFNGASAYIESNNGLNGSGYIGQLYGSEFETLGEITLTSSGSEVDFLINYYDGQEGRYTFVRE